MIKSEAKYRNDADADAPPASRSYRYDPKIATRPFAPANDTKLDAAVLRRDPAGSEWLAMRSDAAALAPSRPVRTGFWARVRAFFRMWMRREIERRQLLAMSELERRDIGISWVDVVREANKPFWRE